VDGWNIQFRRNLDNDELLQWNHLSAALAEIALLDEPDKIAWSLESSGLFSTKSMYKALIKGPRVPLTVFIWKAPIPLKIKLRGGPSDGNCALCGAPENADHIFFQCILAKFLWSGVRAMFGVNWNPSSRHDWFTILNSISTKAKRFVWVFFAAQSWALWTTRNKFTIEGKIPSQPANCIF
jgi:hypothetical protein